MKLNNKSKFIGNTQSKSDSHGVQSKQRARKHINMLSERHIKFEQVSFFC